MLASIPNTDGFTINMGEGFKNRAMVNGGCVFFENPVYQTQFCGLPHSAEWLSREQTSELMIWCDCQPESLWEGLNLQEILNVYRVSSAWEPFKAWMEEEPKSAEKAYNAVVREENHICVVRIREPS